jgi:hypothetical protein
MRRYRIRTTVAWWWCRDLHHLSVLGSRYGIGRGRGEISQEPKRATQDYHCLSVYLNLRVVLYVGSCVAKKSVLPPDFGMLTYRIHFSLAI